MLLLSSADIFSKLTFSIKNTFRNTIRVSNDLDPNQDRHFAKLNSRRQKSSLARRAKHYLKIIQNQNLNIIFSVHTSNMWSEEAQFVER